mmetsp:Transcript_38168/g.91707  ORF Transcript_38168/g.91707 Transcript_38168/m.91707 type:complete len:380 (+) Transcript_38168:1007-2146(+)
MSTTTDSQDELISSHSTSAREDSVTLATSRSFMYSSSSTGVSAPASWRLRVSPRFSSWDLASWAMVFRALSVLMQRMVRARTAAERRPIMIQAQRYIPGMLQLRPSAKSHTVATKNPISVITSTTSNSKLVHRNVYMLMGANSPATTTDTGGIAALFSAALSSTAKSSLASLMSRTLKRSRETSFSSRPRKSRLPDWRCSRRFCKALRTLSCFRISGVTYRAPFSASSFAWSASPRFGSTGRSSSSLSGSSSSSRFRASWSIFFRSSRVGSWLFLYTKKPVQPEKAKAAMMQTTTAAIQISDNTGSWRWKALKKACAVANSPSGAGGWTRKCPWSTRWWLPATAHTTRWAAMAGGVLGALGSRSPRRARESLAVHRQWP